MRRDFRARCPDELWLAGFTYVRTWEGWAYQAVVLDVRTRRRVGRQLAPHIRQSLVTDAFEMALAADIAPSRGRTDTALDNAVAESVLSTLTRELISRYRRPTRLDRELALVTRIGRRTARQRGRSLKTGRDGQSRRQAPQQVLDRHDRQALEPLAAQRLCRRGIRGAPRATSVRISSPPAPMAGQQSQRPCHLCSDASESHTS